MDACNFCILLTSAYIKLSPRWWNSYGDKIFILSYRHNEKYIKFLSIYCHNYFSVGYGIENIGLVLWLHLCSNVKNKNDNFFFTLRCFLNPCYLLIFPNLPFKTVRTRSQINLVNIVKRNFCEWNRLQ